MVGTGRERQRRVGERAHPAGEKPRKGGTTGSRKGATPEGRSPREGPRKRAGGRGNSEEHPGSRSRTRSPRWTGAADRRTGRESGFRTRSGGLWIKRSESGAGEVARSTAQPGASRLDLTPHVGQAELFGATLDRRRTDAATRRGGRWGAGRSEPHGCEWSKHTTGFGEAETVMVVENGEGGPKRVWKPVTRRSRKEAVRAVDGRPSREVDSPNWERRRGEKPHGRRFRDGRAVFAHRTDVEGRGRGGDPRG
jgi:hypothetical protein